MMQRREFLQAAAAVAGATAGDVPEVEITAQQNCLLELANRDDEDRWEYEATRNLAHVRSGLVNAELDALCDNPNGIVQTHVVGHGGIPLGFEVSTGDDESVGTLVHLSAEQAEALAVDLLEQAHAQRRITMQTSGTRVTARIVRTADGETTRCIASAAFRTPQLRDSKQLSKHASPQNHD